MRTLTPKQVTRLDRAKLLSTSHLHQGSFQAAAYIWGTWGKNNLPPHKIQQNGEEIPFAGEVRQPHVHRDNKRALRGSEAMSQPLPSQFLPFAAKPTMQSWY